MTTIPKPDVRPANPRFSSGPCAKRPGWTPEALLDAALGRSHRAKIGKSKLKQAIDLTREVLGVPDDYRIGIVPASDTGAVEMAMWSMLGARGTDMVAWESFGEGWITDVVKQLKLDDVRKITAPYGELPDLSTIDFDRDVVFTWNGTTSGVRVPNADFIPPTAQGLTICDATSAAFAQDLDFAKLDVVTFSWQKVLGGEGGHGVLILSPRAVERLESYTYRLAAAEDLPHDQGRQADRGHLRRRDHQHAVDAVRRGLSRRAHLGEEPRRAQGPDRPRRRQCRRADRFVADNDWIENLAKVEETRSNTSVCLVIADPDIAALPPMRRPPSPRRW
jgi:phosphoserine aminotransferase